MLFKLLVHPSPYKYETLSNYIFRLSEGNCSDINWLNKEFQISHLINSSDKYNISVKPASIDLIINATGLSYKKVVDMTINRLNACHEDLTAFCLSKELDAFILKNKNYFCPKCLKETNYERIYWKSKHIKICLLHNLLLINTCENCGKTIDFNELLMRECSCGYRLDNMSSIVIDDYSIINHQNRIFNIFNISEGVSENFVSEPIGKTIIEYLKLIYYIDKIVSKYLNYLIEISFFQYNSKYPMDVNQLIAVEETIQDWPNNFYKLIDTINEFEKPHLNLTIPYLISTYYSPIAALGRAYTHYELAKPDIISEQLYTYFCRRYNLEYFFKVLKPLLVEDRFIEFTKASDIFNLPYNFIKQKFTTFTNKNEPDIVYLDLIELVNFFKQFIKEDNSTSDRGSRTLLKLARAFNYLDINLTDILNLILDKNIQIKIDSSENGVFMLDVPERETKILILEHVLNKLKTMVE